MKQKLIIGLILIPFLFPSPCFAQLDPQLDNQYQASGGQEIEDYYNRELKEELSSLLPDFSFQQVLKNMITGQVDMTPTGVFHWIGSLLWGELKANAGAFGLLLLLIVLSGITGQLNAFGSGSPNTAGLVFGAVMCAIVVEMFDLGVRQSQAAIASMSEFVTVLTPVMAALLAGAGQLTGATLLHPVLYAAASFSVNTVNRWILPLIYGCFLLCVANSLSDNNQLDGIIGLLKNSLKWILSGILTVFSGLTAIYSVAGQNVDIMLSKTTRFTVGNFVPVVGSTLSESVELVLSFSSVLKRGVGWAGMVVLALLFLHVALNLTIQLWMFRIGSAFAVPLGSPALGKLLSNVALCIGMMLAALCVCTVLFCLILIIMITAGGGGLL